MNLLSGQQAPELKPLNINGEDEWEIDKFSAVHKLCNYLEYCICWVSLCEATATHYSEMTAICYPNSQL